MAEDAGVSWRWVLPGVSAQTSQTHSSPPGQPGSSGRMNLPSMGTTTPTAAEQVQGQVAGRGCCCTGRSTAAGGPRGPHQTGLAASLRAKAGGLRGSPGWGSCAPDINSTDFAWHGLDKPQLPPQPPRAQADTVPCPGPAKDHQAGHASQNSLEEAPVPWPTWAAGAACWPGYLNVRAGRTPHPVPRCLLQAQTNLKLYPRASGPAPPPPQGGSSRSRWPPAAPQSAGDAATRGRDRPPSAEQNRGPEKGQ